ncbi:MAG: hypothetical protein HY589_05555 [Candidatus Omnitrophica bacterium]|nr:hypothetical protein [Candidatus Omnitrophota bacterium]
MRKILFIWCACVILFLPFDFHLSRVGLNIPGVETLLVLAVAAAFLMWEILTITEGRFKLIHVWGIDILLSLLLACYLFSSIRVSPIRFWSLKYTLRLFGFSFVYYAILNFTHTKKQLFILILALISGGVLAAALSIIQAFLPAPLIESMQNFFHNAGADAARTNGPFVSVNELVLFLSCIAPVAIACAFDSYMKKNSKMLIAWTCLLGIITACLIKLASKNGLAALFTDANADYPALWKAAARFFIEHPFKGIGADLFAWKFMNTGFPVIRARNQFLEILLSSGIIGLAVFLGLSFLSIRLMFKNTLGKTHSGNNSFLRIGLAAGLMVYLVFSCFNDYFAAHETIGLFWALMGLGVRASLMDEMNDKSYIKT